MTAPPPCVFCAPELPAGDILLWEDARLRVALIDEPGYPGFCRVICKAHVREMTDLPPGERQALMAMVWHVEAVLREVLQPTKINLASLGNLTPHLHWHVIPRWSDDRHFPQPIWAAALREGAPAAGSAWAAFAALPDPHARAERLRAVLLQHLAAAGTSDCPDC